MLDQPKITKEEIIVICTMILIFEGVIFLIIEIKKLDKLTVTVSATHIMSVG